MFFFHSDSSSVKREPHAESRLQDREDGSTVLREDGSSALFSHVNSTVESSIEKHSSMAGERNSTPNEGCKAQHLSKVNQTLQITGKDRVLSTVRCSSSSDNYSDSCYVTDSAHGGLYYPQEDSLTDSNITLLNGNITQDYTSDSNGSSLDCSKQDREAKASPSSTCMASEVSSADDGDLQDLVNNNQFDSDTSLSSTDDMAPRRRREKKPVETRVSRSLILMSITIIMWDISFLNWSQSEAIASYLTI